MHVSEQPAEVEACIGEYGRRPVELLHDNGILDESDSGGARDSTITDEEAKFLGRSTGLRVPYVRKNTFGVDGAVPADKLFECRCADLLLF